MVKEKEDIFLSYGIARLRNTMGDDLDVVNVAKVSYSKESPTFKTREERLLRFLADNEHSSPFRHQIVQFEVYCPLMVARQWWKYRIGSTVMEQSSFDFDTMESWNESSRRYITEKEQFLLVDIFREAPENSKQGSGPPVTEELNAYYKNELWNHTMEGLQLYKSALADGICAEQARLFLPAYGLYVRFIWTVSLLGFLHFLEQRLEDDAQKEIQDYARDCAKQVQPCFPRTFEVFDIKV